MRKMVFLLLLIIPSALYAQQMNIISFNIRYNTPNDGINAWPNRIEMVTGLLRFYDAGIFGLQEALYGQIIDIENRLPGYAWIGVGRDDGNKEGEFCPVFYNKSAFTLLDHGTFWLSETPQKPSFGWDAACKRVTTWARFKAQKTGKEFLVFNTHFDHQGQEARKNSAVLIREKIEEMTYNKDLPVILTGDFNLTPGQFPISLLKKYLNDSRDVSKEVPYGPVGTYNGFNPDAVPDKRIDYIFVQGDMDVLKYAVLDDQKDDRFPSDHLPVFITVELF